MIAAILNSAFVGLSHCHLEFRHLVIFFQIHSETLSLHSDSDSNQVNLTQTHSFLPNLMMSAILKSAIMNLANLDSAILVFPLKLTHTCQDWFPPFAHKKYFTHSFWPNLMMAVILNICHLGFRHCHFAVKHSCYLLWDSLRNTLTPLWLWFKLIQSD